MAKSTGLAVRAFGAGLLLSAVTVLNPVTASKASAATTSCHTVAACLFGANTGPGFGIAGNGTRNSGVFGSTSFNATSTSRAAAGVYGADLSTNNGAFDAGVVGVSTSGNGVRGASRSGEGVLGASASGTGVAGTSKTGVALSGYSAGGDGVDGITGSPGASGVYGYDREDRGGGYGVYGDSLTGIAVYGIAHNNSVFAAAVVGESRVGNGVEGIADSSEVYSGAALVGTAGDQGTFAFVGQEGSCDVLPCDNGGSTTSSIDYYGNMILAGTLTQNGSPFIRTRAVDGAAYVSYGARMTVPDLEDVGEARIVRGSASIALERTFGATIDRRAPYLVFLTPLGDTRGLYVSRRGPEGFDVRETGGGRGDVAFEYRIVAKPLDTNGARMAAASTLRQLPKKRASIGKP